jgi:pimeloyl-ACP methyl ester carboxylesterase
MTMGRISKLLTLCVALIPISSRAVEIYDHFPDAIHANERYVIYSHGLIVEGDDPRPISPKYGQYDFPGIKQAIFESGGFNLVAPQRPKDPDYNNYVTTVESWVHRLLHAGVKPSRITLVGFSRGGQLTALISSRLAQEGINTAILAICEDGDFVSEPPFPGPQHPILGGNFLSIYETSDIVGSCTKLAARSHLNSFREVAISTGKKHGAFFQPLPDWIRPLQAWIAETNR